MIIRNVDFETTGIDPAKDGAAVCEIGWCDLCMLPPERPDDGKPNQWVPSAPRSILVNPGHKIPPAMSGIHHITDDMVAGAPPFSVAAVPLLEGNDVILCAHNNRFEMKFFTVPAKWIDTYRVALAHAPKAPDHKLQTLRYWLKLQGDEAWMNPPHRAAADAYTCALLLQRMLTKLSVVEMLDISTRPALLPKFIFGKYAMMPIEEIPTSYLDWVVDNIKDDEDVQATARYHIEQRKPQREMLP